MRCVRAGCSKQLNAIQDHASFALDVQSKREALGKVTELGGDWKIVDDAETVVSDLLQVVVESTEHVVGGSLYTLVRGLIPNNIVKNDVHDELTIERETQLHDQPFGFCRLLYIYMRWSCAGIELELVLWPVSVGGANCLNTTIEFHQSLKRND